MNIMLVHLGDKKVIYLNDCINQLLKFNKNTNIHLISSKKTLNGLSNSNKNIIHFHDTKLIEISKDHQKFKEINNLDRKWYNGFWLHTTERFFYLKKIVSEYNLKNIIHIENDCLVYFSIKSKIRHFYKKYNIAVVPEKKDKVIPVFMYFKNKKFLNLICNFFLQEHSNINIFNFFKYKFKKKMMNDMFILQNFFVKNYSRNKIFNLPTTNFRMIKKTKEKINFSNNFNLFGGIFDPSYIGLTLDGFDKSSSIFKNVNYLNFINSPFNIKRYKIIFLKKNGLKIPYLFLNNIKIKILNLHLHSKNLKKYLS